MRYPVYGKKHAAEWYAMRCPPRRMTYAQIAKAAGVSSATVQRVLKRHKDLMPEALRSKPQPKQSEEEPKVEEIGDELKLDDEVMSVEEQKLWLSRFVRRAQAEADRLAVDGDAKVAAKQSELAFKATNTLARLSKGDSEDAVVIPREEVRATADKVREKVKALLNTGRPLLCSQCSRKLSVAWGRGGA